MNTSPSSARDDFTADQKLVTLALETLEEAIEECVKLGDPPPIQMPSEDDIITIAKSMFDVDSRRISTPRLSEVQGQIKKLRAATVAAIEAIEDMEQETKFRLGVAGLYDLAWTFDEKPILDQNTINEPFHKRHAFFDEWPAVIGKIFEGTVATCDQTLEILPPRDVGGTKPDWCEFKPKHLLAIDCVVLFRRLCPSHIRIWPDGWLNTFFVDLAKLAISTEPTRTDEIKDVVNVTRRISPMREGYDCCSKEIKSRLNDLEADLLNFRLFYQYSWGSKDVDNELEAKLKKPERDIEEKIEALLSAS